MNCETLTACIAFSASPLNLTESHDLHRLCQQPIGLLNTSLPCAQIQAYGAGAVTTTTPTAPGSPFSFVVTYTCQTVALKTAVPATRLVIVACTHGGYACPQLRQSAEVLEQVRG